MLTGLMSQGEKQNHDIIFPFKSEEASDPAWSKGGAAASHRSCSWMQMSSKPIIKPNILTYANSIMLTLKPQARNTA